MSAAKVKCWGVIPAAGVGSRMEQSTPKQYLEIAGKTLLEHSLAALLGCAGIERVAVALQAQDTFARSLALLDDPRVIRAQGAAQRSGSVLAGLRALESVAAADDWVLVHDAARPCLAAASVKALIETVVASGVGGLLAEPVVDTVKRADANGYVEQTLDRSCLWRAQTPQMFRLGELVAALEAAERDGRTITDEASAMELAGHRVQLVAGSSTNLKVTLPQDLALAQWYLTRRDQ